MTTDQQIESEIQAKGLTAPRVTLSPRQKAAIAGRVKSGRLAQALFPRGGFGHTKADE